MGNTYFKVDIDIGNLRGLANNIGVGSEAQRKFDEYVYAHMSPYVPYLTGALSKSPESVGRFGFGQLVYSVPYANYQYHFGREPGLSKFGPLRGLLWAERYVNENITDIENAAKQIIREAIR